jgi:hypothetical protein
MFTDVSASVFSDKATSAWVCYVQINISDINRYRNWMQEVQDGLMNNVSPMIDSQLKREVPWRSMFLRLMSGPVEKLPTLLDLGSFCSREFHPHT